MAKKLKVELDVETSKAKNKVQKDLGGAIESKAGGGRSGGTASAERFEKALERASKGAEKFWKETEQGGAKMSNALKAMAGFGAGMALNYASRLAPEGIARNTMKQAGAGLQGASAGMGVGDALADSVPGGKLLKWGLTTGGAALGMAGERAAQEKERKDQLDAINLTKSQFKDAQIWRDEMRKLTEMPTGFDGAEGLKLLNKQLEVVKKQSEDAANIITKLAKKENELYEAAKKAAEESKLEESAKKQQEMAQVQAKIMQAEAAKHNADRQAASLGDQIEHYKKPVDTLRAGLSGTDALTRIGGSSGIIVADPSSRAPIKSSSPTYVGAGFEEKVVTTIDKAVAKKSPQKQKGIYFQDEKPPSLIDRLDQQLLDEEKETNKLLEDLVNVTKSNGRTSWQ